MLTVIVYGLAIGAIYAATALVYNVMYSTSKVLSVTTGHIPMLGGVLVPTSSQASGCRFSSGSPAPSPSAFCSIC